MASAAARWSWASRSAGTDAGQRGRFRERRPNRAAQRGFALILTLVILVLGSLYGIVTSLADITRIRLERAQGTVGALAQAKEALLGYATTYRDTHDGEVFGYLPCPDTDGDGDAEPSCGSAGETAVGLLPYETLRLSDLRDSSQTCLWYVVSGNYKYNPKTVPMNWDAQGQIAILDANGNTLTAPDDAAGGAAAVIIAAGMPLPENDARTTGSSRCGIVPTEVSSYLESTITASGTTTLTQGDVKDAGDRDRIVNNDRILALSPKEIFEHVAARTDFRAALAAGGHLNTLTDEMRAALEKSIQADLLASGAPTGDDTPANQGGYSQYSGKLIGDPQSLTLGNADYQEYFDNWKDQYRQVVCSDLTTTCLTIAGTACRGALLFGGQSATGGPRPSTQKPPATLPAPPNAYLANYFEAGSGLEILDSAATTFAGSTSYSDPDHLASARALDVATCLFPGAFVSFARDTGSLTSEVDTGTTPEAAIDTVAKTVTLGNPAATTSGSGCVWYPSSLPFGSQLRAYFKFRISNRGEGFMFAIADAARNASGPTCGDSAGSRMGYNGNTYPKFGLEIDSRLTSARNDPDAGTAAADEHYAFVYWGGTSGINDDNSHNTGTDGSTTQPRNPTSSKVQSASWSSNKVTIRTSSDDNWSSGQQVVVAGITPSGYNGSHTITYIDSTHFSYPLTTNPGSYSSGGTVSSGSSQGLRILTGSDSFLPANTSWATATDYHVRLDISKSYTSPSGTYTLKAYVASTFPSCSSADFQDLSRDLEDLCTSMTPGIEQKDIVIGDITGYGEAMANVYVGFTNAQSSASASEQTVVISDFQIRSQ